MQAAGARTVPELPALWPELWASDVVVVGAGVVVVVVVVVGFLAALLDVALGFLETDKLAGRQFEEDDAHGDGQRREQHQEHELGHQAAASG